MRLFLAVSLAVALAGCSKGQSVEEGGPTEASRALADEPPTSGATPTTTVTAPQPMPAADPMGWAESKEESKKEAGGEARPGADDFGGKEDAAKVAQEAVNARLSALEGQQAQAPAFHKGELDFAQGEIDGTLALGGDGAGSTASLEARRIVQIDEARIVDGDMIADDEPLEEAPEAESEDTERSAPTPPEKARFTVHVPDADKRSETGKKGLKEDDGDGKDERPASFLPRKLYFENTYLGGDAAFREQMRRLDESLGGAPLPHTLSLGYAQPFDPPEDAGLSLTAELDRRFLERSGRVILQVGLQGSLRYGWRRPPLDVVLVLDGPALAEDPEVGIQVAGELLAQLGPQDHLAVIVAGPRPRVLAPLGRIRSLRGELALAFDALGAIPASSDDALAAAMTHAGALLEKATEDRATLPGTQTVLVVARGLDGARVQPARSVAHELTLKGMVTSVIETGPGDGLWWAVNDAGYGNYHQVAGRDPREAVRAELESLSRVVARLVRINVRLAPGVEAVRILGSRVLDEQEVARVKAREVAADQHISRTLGVVADRGDDDDGLQTVIPYFYGGDSHVVLIELWVDKPGAIADVTLRYKDMVNLGNATARASVAARNLPREDTAEQLAVRRNVRGFRIGEELEHASLRLKRGDLQGARTWLGRARETAAHAPASDREVIDAFAQALDAGDLTADQTRRDAVSESLFVAGRRKVGDNKAMER